MREQEFVTRIQERTDLASERTARGAAEATLRTLDERVEPDVAESVADRLPDTFAASMGNGGDDVDFPEGFVERVALREEVTVDEAGRHARAVLATLEERLVVGESGVFERRPAGERGGPLEDTNWKLTARTAREVYPQSDRLSVQDALHSGEQK